MKPDTNTDPLGEALQKLETNLETPIVPGELSPWIRNLRESCDLVGRSLAGVVPDSHEERFRQIAEQDPELLPRVQQLREEDREVLREFEAVARELSNLDNQPAERLANQPAADERIAQIVKKGLEFVIRARTQETAVSTWHMEAFQRDRGFGD